MGEQVDEVKVARQPIDTTLVQSRHCPTLGARQLCSSPSSSSSPFGAGGGHSRSLLRVRGSGQTTETGGAEGVATGKETRNALLAVAAVRGEHFKTYGTCGQITIIAIVAISMTITTLLLLLALLVGHRKNELLHPAGAVI